MATSGAIRQAREFLADMLLEMLSLCEALADYELASTALGHVPPAEFAAWDEPRPEQVNRYGEFHTLTGPETGGHLSECYIRI
jgi:hypothetical protein